MPSETALSILALTSSGTLLKHPRLKLCFAHAGGAFPALLGRIQHGYDCRPDLLAGEAGGVSPSDHMSRGGFWVDSLVHDPDLLEFLCKKIGSNRIVMGSDYPFPLGGEYTLRISGWNPADNNAEVPMAGKMLCSEKQLGKFLTWRERANMLAGNAIALFNMGPSFQTTFQNRLSVFEKKSSMADTIRPESMIPN
jgi:aminocarboxymuconate-semialdehyde decarboxylase